MAGEGVSGALPRSSSAGPGKPMPGWTRSPPSSSAKRDTESRSVSGLPPPPPEDVQRATQHLFGVPAQSCVLCRDPRDRAVTALAGAHPGAAGAVIPSTWWLLDPRASDLKLRWYLPSHSPRWVPESTPPPHPTLTTPLPPSRLHVGGLG